MRRSGAPSQLRGNAAKIPRFMPPGPARNDGPPLSSPQPEPSVPSPPAPTALGNVLLNKVQKCLSSADAPAVTNAPVGSKALARVLSAVPQGKFKENGFRSSPDFPEPEQPSDKDSCSTQPSTHHNSTATVANAQEASPIGLRVEAKSG